MASTKEFLCIIPDNAGAHDKRIGFREAHVANLKPNVESGRVVAGGALLNEHPAPGQSPSIRGSMTVLTGENEAEIRDHLAKDIYATSGVWDLRNAQVIPLNSAIRVALNKVF